MQLDEPVTVGVVVLGVVQHGVVGADELPEEPGMVCADELGVVEGFTLVELAVLVGDELGALGVVDGPLGVLDGVLDGLLDGVLDGLLDEVLDGVVLVEVGAVVVVGGAEVGVEVGLVLVGWAVVVVVQASW